MRRALSLDALTIGFARRFATYKRATLLMRDMEILASLVNGVIVNLTSGKSLTTAPPPAFLLEMLRSGGLIPFLKSGGILQK